MSGAFRIEEGALEVRESLELNKNIHRHLFCVLILFYNRGQFLTIFDEKRFQK